MESNLPFTLDAPIPITPELKLLLEEAYAIAADKFHEFLTPEHVLLDLLSQEKFIDSLEETGIDVEALTQEVAEYVEDLDRQSEESAKDPEPSIQFHQMMNIAVMVAAGSGRNIISIPHVVKAILSIPESFAHYLLEKAINNDEGNLMGSLITRYDMLEDFNNAINHQNKKEDSRPSHDEEWKNYVTVINDIVRNHNPLIGRKEELEKTIRVLCRKDKNNPLHIGEPGVGKTALVFGLAQLINEGEVPEKLQESTIYQIDLGTLLAGTQFRGDFEKRIKLIMNGVASTPSPIVYIDEIHNLVGAGATGEGSMDASNMLKPYLENGEIRFIGSTTYDEYKKHFAKSKGIVRRFTQIDVPEPDVEQTIRILTRLKPNYEEFHKVTYSPEAIEFAVKGSKRYMPDRFLPDKAIDLIDEAGAYRHIHPSDEDTQTVDSRLIAEILAKVSKVESISMNEEETAGLEFLEERISAEVFGQSQAVKEVAEAVQLAKAGLTDETKPLASLLFIGPTGVGKTELAKVLASQLSVELIRFDMSEYTEKHTVAKLIGSPAGYVGYEDGGLLTDAIRKNPDSVVLLDEIEKAHPDIYNIMLQVMDYGKLTDNKGNKADFRNTIIIMTSNAGAQYASQAKVGFESKVTSGEAMMRQVKKTFKPEFLNRLSATVVFNDMNREMAALILTKKLNELKKKLKVRNVELELSEKAFDFLLDKGFTAEYGAREIERTLNSSVKPLLMKEILFGKLKKGGTARMDVTEGGLELRVEG